jgi:hypothetical protein
VVLFCAVLCNKHVVLFYATVLCCFMQQACGAVLDMQQASTHI